MLSPCLLSVMSVSSNDAGPPDTGTSGPILFQALLQYLLQGVVLSQGIKFSGSQEDHNDCIAMRIYVVALILLSILQTSLETYKVWHEVIDRRHWYLSPLHWSEFLLNGIICTWSTLVLVTLVANVILAVRIETTIGADSGYADPLRAGHWCFPLWVFGSLLLSLGLTGILSWCLYKSRTGVSQTDKVVQTIINATWETASLPTACAIIAAAFYCSKELTKVRHLDLFFILLTAKLYTLGILRTLNLRARFRERLMSHDLGGRQSLSDFQWNSGGSARTGSADQACVGPLEPVSPKTVPAPTSRMVEHSRGLPSCM
ncbi:uncharacterized protein C8Q71DRAFT_172399 [Rhodofomes roseus]|uniref:DUF6534 domain-containing protein n=1 Tax=Rhodofomes roseus TaxID=34475 RepID=A0ABQ8K9H1_9APHY|nr:uncharacterized protein C8Q71DRAFT_172399 [Rhodofomes roseus]KAH9833739.1 hypothetical protein C8Q71DRAFT_172399 [Rhodofomes roseus]